MKAVMVIEWDLDESEVAPEDWQRAAVAVRDRVREMIEPAPLRAWIAIQEPAEAVLAAIPSDAP